MQTSHTDDFVPSPPAAGDGVFRSRSFRSAADQFDQCIKRGKISIRFAAACGSGGRTLARHVATWGQFDDQIKIIRLPELAVDVDVRLMPLHIDEVPQLLNWIRQFEGGQQLPNLSTMQLLARHHSTGGLIGPLLDSLTTPEKTRILGDFESSYDSRSAMRASS